MGTIPWYGMAWPVILYERTSNSSSSCSSSISISDSSIPGCHAMIDGPHSTVHSTKNRWVNKREWYSSVSSFQGLLLYDFHCCCLLLFAVVVLLQIMVRTLSNIGSAIVGMGMGMGMGMGAVVVGGCRCYSDSNNNNTTTTTRIPLTQKLYIIASSPMDTVHWQ